MSDDPAAQYRRDVRAAMWWMVSSPDRIVKAQRDHREGEHGHCAARMCRNLPHPCLTRWIADEATTYLLPAQREAIASCPHPSTKSPPPAGTSCAATA